MPITKGHGNPKWTHDEVVLALDLYFDCAEKIPDSADDRVRRLSALLRGFPQHALAARKSSFRNPAGVAFKLQNLRQVATNKGLPNVSKVDREVWEALGHDPARTKRLANLIREGIATLAEVEPFGDAAHENVEFDEGRIATVAHMRRERNGKLREAVLASRRRQNRLACDMCGCRSSTTEPELAESVFECHHLVPLAQAGKRKTKLEDMALLCANCHRILHKAIALRRRWLPIKEAQALVAGTFKS